MNRGKLIVIEGSDGSGKSTQLELLRKYLQNVKIPSNTLKFPRYDSFFGKIIASYLKGELGSLDKINSYLISVVYAADRADAKEILNTWLSKGSVVVMDRYATSNMAHQYARLPEKERATFLSWLLELEYRVNKIPKEDLVIFLHVPYTLSQKLLGNKEDDIHEDNAEFLKKSEETYLFLAKKFLHWVTVECVKNGKLRSKTDIHNEIVGILRKKNIL